MSRVEVGILENGADERPVDNLESVDSLSSKDKPADIVFVRRGGKSQLLG